MSILLNSPWDRSHAAQATLPTIQSMKHALIFFTLRTVPVRHTNVTVHVNKSLISKAYAPLSRQVPMFLDSHENPPPKWPFSAVSR